ncbi:carbonic anhydrase, family 3 [hydrothermal vent metagenome]|jgi:carbonic anhydrase/acetyltransferase-like protein (isoleucine patch superfamily)|uniref:Carbonic anhydrase, family 3 n=2 Tax=ecological metagenomes TaxID=410657 RepID=A0A160VDA3_9ZZZZ
MEKSDLSPDVSIKTPQIHETAYVAEGAQVIGDVILKADSSIWYNTVCRADINRIVIGERTNIQDNSVIHLENDQGVLVENDVTVGHNAIIHGCSIADGALIGMGAIIMNGAVIGKGVVIGAGAVVKEDMVIPDFSLVVGVPGKIVKTLSPETYDDNVKWAAKYVKLANVHRNK